MVGIEGGTPNTVIIIIMIMLPRTKTNPVTTYTPMYLHYTVLARMLRSIMLFVLLLYHYYYYYQQLQIFSSTEHRTYSCK